MIAMDERRMRTAECVISGCVEMEKWQQADLWSLCLQTLQMLAVGRNSSQD
jgi:hypothetical protein